MRLGQRFQSAGSVWLVRGGDDEELTITLPNREVPSSQPATVSKLRH